MSPKNIDADLVILGGGAVGTLVAMLGAERGYRCLVLRLSDKARPEAETLRNQAWLQSGAFFTRIKDEEDIPSQLSLRLRAQGLRLLQLLNLPESKARGLARFSLAHETEISTFIADARQLGLGAVIRKIQDSEAKRLTGPLYRPGTVCVEVPDAPFDEAAMLVTARTRAQAGGARFIEVEAPVTLERVHQHPGWHLIIGRERFTAPRLVLAAGIGNLDLLEQLHQEHHLRVRRTPLLVIPHTQGVIAPILVDRSLKLAVARHGSEARLPEGCLVAGVSTATPVSRKDLATRLIPCEEWEKIYEVLPQQLQPDRNLRHRFTCGYEIMRGGPDRVRKEDLIVETVSRLEGVVLALPGRATLAYRAAERVLEEYALAESADVRQSKITFTLATSEPWTGPINMHHQAHYDHLDERA